jgi:uncharacterized SAM-binding protein YcdF (DUF218 family)
LFAVITVAPLGAWLLAPLEERFPPPDPMPATIAGIIVLGGGQDARLTVDRGRPTVNDAAERMIEAVALMRRYPDAQVVFTGGLGVPGMTEADVAREFFVLMGADTGRILFEDGARNTYENALATYQLVEPAPASTWLLVTSAVHMPRSMAVFRKAGWPVVAYPVDYRTAKSWKRAPWLTLAGHLADLDSAVHEYVGLVAYWALDRTDDPWPEP